MTNSTKLHTIVT